MSTEGLVVLAVVVALLVLAGVKFLKKRSGQMGGEQPTGIPKWNEMPHQPKHS